MSRLYRYRDDEKRHKKQKISAEIIKIREKNKNQLLENYTILGYSKYLIWVTNFVHLSLDHICNADVGIGLPALTSMENTFIQPFQ